MCHNWMHSLSNSREHLLNFVLNYPHYKYSILYYFLSGFLVISELKSTRPHSLLVHEKEQGIVKISSYVVNIRMYAKQRALNSSY